MIYIWPRYDSAFGAPLARALGIGYVQELVARLTHTPIESHNSSTNSTLDDNPITFPLNHSLYVDATHEVVVLNSRSRISLIILSVTIFFLSYYCSQPLELRCEWTVALRPYTEAQVFPRIRTRAVLNECAVST
jgi:hypothetical protein